MGGERGRKRGVRVHSAFVKRQAPIGARPPCALTQVDKDAHGSAVALVAGVKLAPGGGGGGRGWWAGGACVSQAG